MRARADLAADGESRPRRAAVYDDSGIFVGTDLQYVFFGHDGSAGIFDKLAITQEGTENLVGGFLRYATKSP